MKKVLQLTGLDCAHCAAQLEREISKLEGVHFASLVFVSQKLTVEYENEEALDRVIRHANAFEEVCVIEKDNEESKPTHKKELISLAFSAIALIVCGVLFHFASDMLFMKIAKYVVFAVLYAFVAYPVLISTVKNLKKGKIFDENFLMTIASLGAFALGELFESVMVVLLYQTGETLQSMAVNASRRSVTKLMELKSEFAVVLDETHGQISKTPEELQVGDILLVRTGEKIPVDGELLGENATLDSKSLTGEAEFQTKKKGENLLSGCINVGDAFTMRVTTLYQESAVKKILDLVENASASKATPEKFITKFARFYTPVVCGLAIVIGVFVPLLSGLKDFTRWVQSALTFLVISCPCALVISVPLTYFSGIGTAAQNGVLIKGATHLDTLAKTKTVALDKTGTLTKGKFSVCGAYGEKEYTAEEILKLAASLEKYSTHPIAKAFESQKDIYAVENIKEIAGRGLCGDIDGQEVVVGNAEHLRENGVTFVPNPKDFGYTLVYVAKNREFIGVVEVGDEVRAEAKLVLQELKRLGVSKTVILTGDRKNRAEKIAQELAVDEVYSNLLPDSKMKTAIALKASGALVYVGDGVNDAPVMTVADCAVSMGTIGSAAAVEASDMVLISDDLRGLCKAIKIAKKTRRIVIQNILFSIVMKAGFMALGVLGVLPLGLALFADVGVMLCAVCNALRVRGKI